MATVNFSVPDDLKRSFNLAFQGRNKSAIIAGLMRQALEDDERQQRRQAAILELTARRKDRRLFDSKAIQDARDQART